VSPDAVSPFQGGLSLRVTDQARALHAEGCTVRNEERFMARQDGGHITHAGAFMAVSNGGLIAARPGFDKARAQLRRPWEDSTSIYCRSGRTHCVTFHQLLLAFDVSINGAAG
jgi:hypothetical protein